MAENELNPQTAQTDYKQAERVRVENPVQQLEESANKLAKLGGFDLIESAIDGVQNLNPAKKARMKIFLTDEEKKSEREALKNTLDLWLALLSDSSSQSEMIEKADQKSQAADKLLKTNLKKAIDATRDLEKSYRSV